MLTFTGRRNLVGDLTNNSSSANLTLMDTLMNEFDRELITSANFDFLEKTATDSTVAAQQFYDLPQDLGKLINVTVKIGDFLYTPLEVSSRTFWDRLNESTTVQSDIPEWYFVFNGQIGFYPTPSSTTANAITYIYKRRQVDLAVADFSTGTITTATNGSTAIVGSGTSWTTGMAGRWFRITAGSAANLGDGQWYEIASITDGTNLVLVKEYQGTSISAGTAAYILGEVSIIPEEFQILSPYRAIEHYYNSVSPNSDRAALYKNLYEEGKARMLAERGSKSTNPAIDSDSRAFDPINPNLHIRL